MSTKREAAVKVVEAAREMREASGGVFEGAAQVAWRRLRASEFEMSAALAAFDAAAPDDEEESETGAQRRARVWSEQETKDEDTMIDHDHLNEGVTPTILLAIYDTLRAIAASVKERK